MSVPNVSYVVVCDDIRTEANGKDILIGVYAGDVLVPAFPAELRIAFWIVLVPNDIGRQDLNFRVSLAGQVPVELSLQGEATEIAESALSMPPIGIRVDQPSVLLLEFKGVDGWRAVKEKVIRLNSSATLGAAPGIS